MVRHIPGQNQALLRLVPGPGERYLVLQSGLTLMGDHGDPLAWGKIAGQGDVESPSWGSLQPGQL